MKFLKKADHCLFVEEESYNWAPARSAYSKGMLVLTTLLMLGVVIFITQLR